MLVAALASKDNLSKNKKNNFYLMASNPLLRWLQQFGNKHRALALKRCDDWGGEAVAALQPEVLLDVGCARGDFLFNYIKSPPREFYGVEAAPEFVTLATQRGLKVANFDLNGPWPYPDNKFDVVFSSQVIEHVHNTLLFVKESYRVLKPGGTVIIMSENLCSSLNTFALMMGYTPFSLMQTCGHYLGNPLGLHVNQSSTPAFENPLNLADPAYSGMTGHVRVLTVRQAREIFSLCKFRVTEARSIGILPMPDWASRQLEKVMLHRGHFLLLRAEKPLRES